MDSPLPHACTSGLTGTCEFRTLVDELPELICRFDLDGTVTFVNRSCATFHQTTPREMVGQRLQELVPDDFVEQTVALLESLAQLTPDAPTQVNITRADAADGLRWQEWTNTALFDAAGIITGVISIGRDVTERVAAEQRARRRAEHDELTGLHNRRSTIEALERFTTPTLEPSPPVGVVFVDMDGLKVLNDTEGHRVGDEALRSLAQGLQAVVRSGDFVGRIGGDEFVLVTSTTDEAALAGLARRIEQHLGGLPRPISVSVGWATSARSRDPLELLHLADQAMYAVKQRRRSGRPAASR
ncbi:MAG: GGDEF domain-containing protein [Actinomycetota bacterium]